ncbi:ABC transporter permease [Shimazuella sp. AN120528]|uniref:ABC transporter permease n=1 Tax=Shimazuella soli TaxID=1892854 RepID=UPI001F0DFBC1|nr:ABC transporter permease [Shimazuella soli]MCH5584423.1 ABC transporter permease [Shimazuella soli]
MFSVFYTEIMKLKNTKLYWLVLLGVLPACLMGSKALFPKISPAGIPLAFDMQDMFYSQGMVVTILGPALFALMIGYIITREYQERTINQLFSYPASRIIFFIAKLLVVFSLIVLTVWLPFVFSIVSTILVKHHLDVSIVWLGMKMNIMICILSFGTIPVAAALSMVGKTIMPNAILGSIVSIFAGISEAGHSMHSILFPWLAPYWPVRNLAQGIAQPGPNPYAAPALIILIFTFVVSLTFCIQYYNRADVHSGS